MIFGERLGIYFSERRNYFFEKWRSLPKSESIPIIAEIYNANRDFFNTSKGCDKTIPLEHIILLNEKRNT